MKDIYELNVEYKEYQIQKYLNDQTLFIRNALIRDELYVIEGTQRVLFEIIENRRIIICVYQNRLDIFSYNDDNWRLRRQSGSYLYHNSDKVYLLLGTGIYRWDLHTDMLEHQSGVKIFENDYYTFWVRTFVTGCYLIVIAKDDRKNVLLNFTSTFGYCMFRFIAKIYTIPVIDGHGLYCEGNIVDYPYTTNTNQYKFAEIIQSRGGLFIVVKDDTIKVLYPNQLVINRFNPQPWDPEKYYYIWDPSTQQTCGFGCLNKHNIPHVINNWKIAFLIWCFKHIPTWHNKLPYIYYMPMCLLFEYIFIWI